MGHQEASPPRHRQRMPHHRRHRRRRSHRSPLPATNHSHLLDLGNSNRLSHAPNSRAIVESWLVQLTVPAPPSPTARLTAPESRNHLVHHGKRPRSQDSYGSPRRHRPRRVDQLWRPHHIPPTQSSCRLPFSAEPPQNAKQYERDSGDSSLISSLGLRRESREWNSTKTTSEYGEIPCSKRLDETKVGTINASSPVSHVALEVSTFEKRPRRKTRPDKYDTRKVKSQGKRGKVTGRGERDKRGLKPKKGKHVAPGKNVMKDFTSEAVTSDRITVHPNLKPGLFDNKRVPKERPIADLSFSEMPFPRQPERGISQQKSLSNSRIRERRRESRELEQISSFFLPTCVESKRRKPTSTVSKDIDTSRDENLSCRESPTSPFSRTVLTRSDRQQSAIPMNSVGFVPDSTSNSFDCRTTSSKTTYFTWSTSQQSPRSRNRVVDARPSSQEKVTRSVTPEDIHEALAATGVFKKPDTRLPRGLHLRKHASMVVGESSPICSSVSIHGDADEERHSGLNREPATETSYVNETKAEEAELARLKERWHAILPPEWKLRRFPENDMSLLNKQQPDMVLEIQANEDHPNRQEASHFDRSKKVEELPLARCDFDDGNFDHSAGEYAMGNGSIPVYPVFKSISNNTATVDEDQVTTTSRDAMPPPPFPSRRSNLLQTANPSPECGIRSPISIKTSQAFNIQSQSPGSNPSAHVSPYVIAAEQYELNEQSEKVIQSVNSVSWLPHTATSSVTASDGEQTLSRLSMRPAIYDGQHKQIDSQAVLRPASLPEIGMNETMADFIARIESEVDGETAVGERYSEPPAEDPAFSIDHTLSTSDTGTQYLGVLDESLRAYDDLPTRTMDELGLQDTFETGKYLYSHNLGARTEDNLARFRTEGRLNDGADEFLEMSEFWRPNRFSQV